MVEAAATVPLLLMSTETRWVGIIVGSLLCKVRASAGSNAKSWPTLSVKDLRSKADVGQRAKEYIRSLVILA